MTSNNIKQEVRAIMADNPGMKYTEALRLRKLREVARDDIRGIPSDFIEIGFTYDDDPVSIDLLRGIFVCGTTGSGKTVAVANIARNADKLGYESMTLCSFHPGEIERYAGKKLPAIDPTSSLPEIASTLEDYVWDESDKKRLIVIEELPHLLFEQATDTPEEVDARGRIKDSLLLLATACLNTAVVVTSQKFDRRLRSLTDQLSSWIALGMTTRSQLVAMGMIDPPVVALDDPKGTAIIKEMGGAIKARIKAPVTHNR